MDTHTSQAAPSPNFPYVTLFYCLWITDQDPNGFFCVFIASQSHQTVISMRTEILFCDVPQRQYIFDTEQTFVKGKEEVRGGSPL